MNSAGQSSAPDSRRTLGIVFLTLFIDLIGFSIIFPLFPAILDHYLPHGGGDGLLARLVAPLAAWAEASDAGDPHFMTAVLFGGVLGSLYAVLQFVCAPLWGRLSDRIGRRKVLLLTITGLAFSYALWFFAGSFWILVAARIIGGIMGGNLSVATAAVADVTSREKRAGGLALVGIAFGLGFIVGPAIGGLSAKVDLTAIWPDLAGIGVNPFSVPAFISFVLALVNLLWVAGRFKETLPVEKRAHAAQDRERAPLLRLLRAGSGPIRRANLVYLIYMLAFSGMEFTLTFLAVERFAFSPAQNGGMFVFIGLVLVIVQGGLVRRLSAPVGEKPLAVAGLACGSAAFLLLSNAHGLGLFFAALAVMALSVGLASPTLSALVSLYSKESEQGLNLGTFRSAGSLARAIGPLLAAFAYFHYGASSAYAFGAVLVCIPLCLSAGLPRPSKETAGETSSPSSAG